MTSAPKEVVSGVCPGFCSVKSTTQVSYKTVMSTYVALQGLKKVLKYTSDQSHREAKESESGGYDITHAVCGKTAKCIHYSVSAKPVSMHLPLTR